MWGPRGHTKATSWAGNLGSDLQVPGCSLTASGPWHPGTPFSAQGAIISAKLHHACLCSLSRRWRSAACHLPLLLSYSSSFLPIHTHRSLVLSASCPRLTLLRVPEATEAEGLGAGAKLSCPSSPLLSTQMNTGAPKKTPDHVLPGYRAPKLY